VDKKYVKILPFMVIGLCLIAVGIALQVSNASVAGYILEGAGIVSTIVFCILTGIMIGKNRRQ
jgi:hypothetical protein